MVLVTNANVRVHGGALCRGPLNGCHAREVARQRKHEQVQLRFADIGEAGQALGGAPVARAVHDFDVYVGRCVRHLAGAGVAQIELPLDVTDSRSVTF